MSNLVVQRVTQKVSYCAEDSGEYVYMLRVRLQDATDELDALIFDDAGSTFFQVKTPLFCC